MRLVLGEDIENGMAGLSTLERVAKDLRDRSGKSELVWSRDWLRQVGYQVEDFKPLLTFSIYWATLISAMRDVMIAATEQCERY
jgi:hypothetical protein